MKNLDELQQRLKEAYKSPITPLLEKPCNVKSRIDLVRQALDGKSLPSKIGAHLLIKTKALHEWHSLTRTVTIGADATNDIVLNSTFVSRIHCRLDCIEGNWQLHDPGSRNGTYVNNIRKTNVLLASGDLIMIGDITLIFVDNTTSERL